MCWHPLHRSMAQLYNRSFQFISIHFQTIISIFGPDYLIKVSQYNNALSVLLTSCIRRSSTPPALLLPLCRGTYCVVWWCTEIQRQRGLSLKCFFWPLLLACERFNDSIFRPIVPLHFWSWISEILRPPPLFSRYRLFPDILSHFGRMKSIFASNSNTLLL